MMKYLALGSAVGSLAAATGIYVALATRDVAQIYVEGVGTTKQLKGIAKAASAPPPAPVTTICEDQHALVTLQREVAVRQSMLSVRITGSVMPEVMAARTAVEEAAAAVEDACPS